MRQIDAPAADRSRLGKTRIWADAATRIIPTRWKDSPDRASPPWRPSESCRNLCASSCHQPCACRIDAPPGVRGHPAMEEDMGKLRLEPEDLRVESFSTESVDARRGTVRGLSGT